jgi:REP element-mobilizing transposase RayT
MQELPKGPYPRRKRIRLDAALYAETAAVASITLCSLNRTPVFRDTDFAEACTALLWTRVEALKVGLHAYCFMPDHLHLLINPSEETSIVDFVRDFKGRSTTLAWQHGHRAGRPGSMIIFFARTRILRRSSTTSSTILFARKSSVIGAHIRSVDRGGTAAEQAAVDKPLPYDPQSDLRSMTTLLSMAPQAKDV